MPQAYTCTYCPAQLRTLREQAFNLASEHYEWFNWRCPLCPIAFETEYFLGWHWNSCHYLPQTTGTDAVVVAARQSNNHAKIRERAAEIIDISPTEPTFSTAQSTSPRPQSMMTPQYSAKRKRDDTPPSLTFSSTVSPESTSPPTPRAPPAKRAKRSDPHGLRGEFHREHFTKRVNPFLSNDMASGVVDLTSPVQDEGDELEKALTEAFVSEN